MPAARGSSDDPKHDLEATDQATDQAVDDDGGSRRRTSRRTHRPEVDPADRTTWPELLTVAQVATILSIGQEAVRALINDGEVEAVKLGGHWRVPRRWLIDRFHLEGQPDNT